MSYFGLKRPTDNVFTVCNWSAEKVGRIQGQSISKRPYIMLDLFCA